MAKAVYYNKIGRLGSQDTGASYTLCFTHRLPSLPEEKIREVKP